MKENKSPWEEEPILKSDHYDPGETVTVVTSNGEELDAYIDEDNTVKLKFNNATVSESNHTLSSKK